MRLFLVCIVCVCSIIGSHAQVINRSEKEPEWVRKGEADLNNLRSNDTYYFKIIQNSGTSLENLRNQKLGVLSTFIGQYNQISGQTNTKIEEFTTQQGHSSQQSYTLTFTNNLRTDVFYARFVDEYWEYISYPDGSKGYEYYALFAVSRQPKEPIFDDFSFSTQYGARGLVRSLIPGMGQMYKGSTAKGLCIISAQAVSIAGIILTECTRASYASKVKGQPEHAQTYHTKASNWETGRNICIGAAAAIYIYNLIDAAVAKGAKRVVVTPRRLVHLSVTPTLMNEGVGLGFALNF